MCHLRLTCLHHLTALWREETAWLITTWPRPLAAIRRSPPLTSPTALSPRRTQTQLQVHLLHSSSSEIDSVWCLLRLLRRYNECLWGSIGFKTFTGTSKKIEYGEKVHFFRITYFKNVKKTQQCRWPEGCYQSNLGFITPEQCHRLIDSMPRRIDAVIHAKGAPAKYWVLMNILFRSMRFLFKYTFLLILCNILIFWDTETWVFIIYKP